MLKGTSVVTEGNASHDDLIIDATEVASFEIKKGVVEFPICPLY